MPSEPYGRDEELSRLETFLADVPQGASALLLEGRAGIGKTTIWRAALASAEARGWIILPCTGAEAESQMAFTVLADLLRGLAEEVGPELPPPQRRALDAALLNVDPGDEPPDWRAVATASLGVIRLGAARAPILIGVDDLQWVDASSARVLQFALRRLEREPVRVLAALRQANNTRDPIGLDRTFRVLSRMHVGPLDLRSLRRLLRDRLGTERSVADVRRLVAMTGGNPLFTLELARAFEEQDVAPGGPASVVPSSDLVAVLQRKLGRLSDPILDFLLLVSATPRPSIAWARRVVGDDRAALRHVSAAAEAGVVQIEAELIEFTHPLYASAVQSMASEAERRAVHARLAETADDLEERARHLALATDGPNAETAAILDRAAEAALSRGAPDAAAELAELATERTDGKELEAYRARLAAASSYRFQAGDTREARSLMSDVVERSTAGPARAEALLQLAQYEWNNVKTIRDLLSRAFAEVRTAASPARLQANLHSEMAYAGLLGGDLKLAASHAATSCIVAEHSGNAATIAQALVPKAWTDFLAGRAWTETIDSAVTLQGELRGMELGSAPRTIRGALRMWSGDLEGARDDLEREHREAVARGQLSLVWEVLVFLAELEVRAGAWERAKRYATEGLDSLADAGLDQAREVHLWSTALVAAHQGEIESARRTALEGLRLAREHGDVFHVLTNASTLGFLELSLANPKGADELLRPLVDVAGRMGMVEPGAFPFLADAVEALVASGDLDTAEQHLLLLEAQARDRHRDLAAAAAGRCRGLLAAARGHHDSAVGALNAALEIHARLPQPFDRARTLLALGQVLRRAKKKSAAREALEHALHTFESLGAAIWIDRARSETARIGGRTPSGLELTPTERRAAELAAAGWRNAEIAAELFISAHTVNANLKRVYRKLGLRSRTELGRALAGDREPQAKPGQPPPTGRILATVLFTDIVASTQRAAELGDEGWRRLLRAHNARVRSQLGRFHGREISTSGDGFLATFDGPARAVMCALAITTSVRELGIEVRASCHTGEIELAGHDVQGIAVHIGARVAALAGPGEVLVTSTVRELTTGSGLLFEDAGEHALRGVPARWRLYRLVAGQRQTHPHG